MIAPASRPRAASPAAVSSACAGSTAAGGRCARVSPRELAALGPKVTLAAGPDAIVGTGVFLCDAETERDLSAIVAGGKQLAPPILWCGSAGLARALAGAAPPVEPVPGEPFLAIVGSGHPVARAQLDRVEGAQPELWIAVREGAAEAEEVRDCIAARGAALVTFLLPDYMFDAEASRRLAAILAELERGSTGPRASSSRAARRSGASPTRSTRMHSR